MENYIRIRYCSDVITDEAEYLLSKAITPWLIDRDTTLEAISVFSKEFFGRLNKYLVESIDHSFPKNEPLLKFDKVVPSEINPIRFKNETSRYWVWIYISDSFVTYLLNLNEADKWLTFYAALCDIAPKQFIHEFQRDFRKTLLSLSTYSNLALDFLKTPELVDLVLQRILNASFELALRDGFSDLQCLNETHNYIVTAALLYYNPVIIKRIKEHAMSQN